MNAKSVDYTIIKKTLPLGVIFAFGIIVRIILFWQDKVIAADGISYVSISRSIFNGDGFAAAVHYPPIYPILIGLFSSFTAYDEVAGKVVSTVMGSLVVIPLYLLGKELFSKKVGYIASILAALSPTLVSISGIVLSQSTYITLLVTALYFFWKCFQSNSYKLAIVSGFLFGTAYLTRPEAIIVLVGVSCVFCVSRSSGLLKNSNLRLLVFVGGAFFVVALPYILLLHKINGTWQLTGKSGVTLADSLGWYLNRPDLKREPGFSGLTYLDIVRQYPDFLWKNPLRNLPAVWAELHPMMWLFALLGLISTFFSTGKGKILLFIFAVLSPLSVLVVFFWIDSHYFSPCLPIIYLLGGEGMESLDRGIRWIISRCGLVKFEKLLPWSIVISVAFAGNAILPSLLADRNVPYDFTQDGARYDHKLIGLMLGKKLPPKSRVMCKSGRICFYGDFQQVDIPQSTLPEILLAAKAGKARYLIVDGSLFYARPQLEPFFTPLLMQQDQILTTGPFEGVPEFAGGLRLVLVYKDPASVGVVVYEFPR